MPKSKPSSVSSKSNGSTTQNTTPSGGRQQKKKAQPDWPAFLFSETTSDQQIKNRLDSELDDLISQYSDALRGFKVIYLYEAPQDSIESYTSDRIYTSLTKDYEKKSQNVLLILLSRGGSIEPAYQISKICSEFSKEKFVVAIPRAAKSAATLICFGASEIHMGPLSEIGPIDPQINRRSVLGYTPSLERIASFCDKYPKSGTMFAEFLDKNVYLPNIGHYERLGESAVQYAEKLIKNKKSLRGKASEIARKFVYEYKDHGFVIDAEEAKEVLGAEMVKTNTPQLRFAEAIHQKLNWVSLCLGVIKSKALKIVGDKTSGLIIAEKKKSEN